MVTSSPDKSAQLMRMATYASTGVALVLILTKTIAWMMTDSVSLLATLIDSCLDAAASILNLLAVRHALEPADKQHRFGHGKAESLAGLGQSTFIAGSALFLCFEAIGRMSHPQPLDAVSVGIGVMLFSILATLGLVFFQQYVIRQSGSTAIKADHLHYKTDLIVNAAVILALILASYGWPGFDPVFAIAIAGYIFFSAWEIAREALDLLMDRELPNERRTRIKEIVHAHPQTRGIHDLRTRKSGMTEFIQLHLELDGDLTLMQAHAIADDVESRILAEFPGAEVIIHEDPHELIEPRPEFLP
ncbi:cation diffusion facilitator family transporter [Mariprofundus erugo]|uniref:cation diffusion facilitator family transporter n=1 Tax=Mariprofundus erugo TaxID=2528639 RepID=UPI0010FF2AA2|nr:cation diffusion facilitator family transporter [Mariprofundus erugo]TLS76946.1 cation diffusion facilitator family transporter [Mariprofundus erugo]